MNNFTFYSPTFFDFGKDEEANTGNLVKRFGGSKVLIHYGGGSVVRSGLLDRVKDSLNKAGIEALRQFLISIGMPKNFEELGAKEEDIEKLAHTCTSVDRNGTMGGFVTLNEKDVANIYRLML